MNLLHRGYASPLSGGSRQIHVLRAWIFNSVGIYGLLRRIHKKCIRLVVLVILLLLLSALGNLSIYRVGDAGGGDTGKMNVIGVLESIRKWPL